MGWDFTHIKHKPRMMLGLDCNEYSFLDYIYQKQSALTAPVKGWCIAALSTISKELGIASRTLDRMAKKMIDLGFLEKSENGRLKRTTPEFYSLVYCQEQRQSGVNDNAKVAQYNQENNAKVANELRQSGGQNNAKVANSNIVSNISKVISGEGEHGPPTDNPVFFAKVILNFLSEKTGKRFIIPDNDTQFRASEKFSYINARFRDGATLENFRDVIEVKCMDWLEDSKMKKFLRPSTLFAKKNFENYLDEFQNIDTSATGQNVNVISSQQEEAKKVLRQLYKNHRNIWKEKYTNKAKTNYVEALRMFYFDNPTLKPSTNGTTTA